MDYLRVCITGFLLSLSTFISAGTVTGLYSVELEAAVDRQAPTELQVVDGLKQVLVKVSGNRDVVNKPPVLQSYPIAESFLQQFSFQNNTADSKGSVVTLQFSKGAIDNLVKQTGFKPLGPQRPTVLFWLVSDQAAVPDYLQYESPEIQMLRDAAKSRGLALQIPLLDLTDQGAMSPEELWGMSEGSIKSASLRYKPDAVVAVKIQSSERNSVRLDGLLLEQSGIEPLSSFGDVNSALLDMINDVSDRLFQPVVSYKLSHFQPGMAIQVGNITSLSDYNLLTRFLKELSVVKSIKAEKINGHDVTLRIQLDGSEQQLIQAMGMELRLKAVAPLRDINGVEILNYRWQG